MDKNNQNIDHDTRWKDIIEKMFEEFVAFFMPDLFLQIDFSRKPEFLKQELHKIVAIPEKEGTKINDSLVKLYLKNGREQWVLIHIEVQGTHETTFSERMFTYYYRIYDKFKIKEITAIALFIGEDVPKNYNQFTNQYFGTKIKYEYNTYIVKKQNETALWKSKNPFAIAVLAAFHIIKTKRDSDDRLKLKIQLAKFIRKHAEKGNFPEKVVVALIQFVVNLMLLDSKRETLFYKNITETYQNKDVMQMTIHDKRFADAINSAYYGTTFEELKEKERRAKEREQKMQMKIVQSILNLHLTLNLSPTQIASVLELELTFVEKILKEKNKEK